MRDRANLVSISLIFLFLIFTPATVSAKEIVVDSNSTGDFRSIQGAVSSSLPGDIIIVKSGTYMENVVVKVAGLTIRPESKNNVLVEYLKEYESVFLVQADNVNISGFRIIGPGETLDSPYGVCLEDVNNCTIKGNVFPEKRLGVSVLNASSNTISENVFLNNKNSLVDRSSTAISLNENSGNNNLTGNTIENGYIDIGPSSSDNFISGNVISNGGGIVFSCCGSGNIIFGNAIFNCSRGIDVYDQKVHISNNWIEDCAHGIELYFADGTRIYNNTIVNCSIGVNLGEGCSGIKVLNNIIISSAEYGLFIPDYEGYEKIYNNYFNNSQNVRVGISEGNVWNTSLAPGINIVGDPFIGGNFWAKPDGTGFSQKSADSDRDGIGDLQYNVNGDESDYLPLVSLSNPEQPVFPVIGESGMNSSFDGIIVKAEPGFPEASFDAVPTEGYAPLSVDFTDLSQNTTERTWDFGDGNSSGEANPTHTYFEAGNYIVNLTVNNENGTDLESLEIVVYEVPVVLPVANFISNPASGNAPLSVEFTDLSQNSITGRNWNFGDGNTSNEQNPSHIYFTAGEYTVNLTVSNANGTDSKTMTITVNEAPNEERVPPVAAFEAYPTSGSVPLSVQFTDHSLNATTRSWDFNNDGVTDAYDAAPVYMYTVPGNYTVNLTVDNEIGTDYTTLQITVYEASSEELVLPVADFSAMPISGTAPLSVQFIDLSQNSITGRNWDFGDGNTSVYQNPTHIYSNAGYYTVNLTVNNENGTNSKTLIIHVSAAPTGEKILPVANFSAYPTSGDAPLSVQFTDLSQGATSRSWDFNNDGTADSNTTNPVYVYTTPGTYTVKLTVFNANGTTNKSSIIYVLDGSSSGDSSSGGSSSGSSSHSSSSGGGGGGGAGGSPEQQSNVNAKELSQAFITSGSSVKFDFPRNATSVLYITFNSKKTTGKTTTIVEMLKGKSTLVPQLPSGEVYKSLNIWVGNSGFATPSNIENAVVCFKVEKSWMRDKNINQSSIVLDRYSDNKWNSLSTSLIGEDSNYYYFTAQTPGFSPFAIKSNTMTAGNLSTKQLATDTKIQPGSSTGNLVQSSSASEAAQKSELSSDQKSTKGKSPNLTVFAMICMIAFFLIAFLFKVDKKP